MARELIDFQRRATALRQARMEGMVARLREAGVPIVMERVIEEENYSSTYPVMINSKAC